MFLFCGRFSQKKKKKTHLPAVQADALDPPPRRQQHRPSGGLVNAAGLHPDEARLDDVYAADPVVPRDLVQLRQERRRRQSGAVERDGIAVLEADLDVGGLVRGGLGGDGAGEHGLGGLDPGVLEGVSCFRFLYIYFISFHFIGGKRGRRVSFLFIRHLSLSCSLFETLSKKGLQYQIKTLTFVRDVEQVGVHRERRLAPVSFFF